MPFLGKATEKVSEKTKIIKWFLPRVLIQTKTYEGFGLKSERNIYEYQDANGNGLTRRKPTDPIAEDMHYGSGGVHTGNFEWFDIKDEAVLKNITELNQYPTENLFEVFKNLIRWTSKGALETNNLNMVNNMRFGGGRYQNSVLTEAVFNHENTKKFVSNIIGNFKKVVDENKGNLNEIKLEPDNLIRPSFSSLNDRLEGLTIALNDTWGFRVTITNYGYNPQTKDVEATLKFRIIDHFGLDVADIESYGTKQKIYAKFGDMLVRKMNTSLDIEKSKSVFEFLRLGYKYTSVKGFILGSLESSGYNPVEQMALGFCAWFILQHLRGYKPFVTIMKKEQTLKFKL
ncbi:DUF3289 family protein [Capnocytophaga cynodegmi]|uniref:DUF3289 family protein n=2 Tax=Capnocytophaga TaxID=1016 RepID=UPI003858619B